MLTRLLRPILLIFGLSLAIVLIMLGINRETIDHAMVVSSNFRDYDQALYLMTEDGVPLQRLTRIPGAEEFISASEDGEWIIIRSLVNLRYYSVHVLTGQVYPIGKDHFVQLYDWSPTSEWFLIIEYDYSSGTCQSSISRQFPNGRTERLVTSPNYFHSPVWSPDGQWIYFSIMTPYPDNRDQIYRISVAGRDIEPISEAADSATVYWLSADGEWVYYVTRITGESGDRLARMRPNGEDAALLTALSEGFFPHDWSAYPDWIYYSTRREQQTEIYRLNTVTGEEQQLTDLEDKDYIIDWSPDGERLTFRNLHHPSNTMTVYQMRLDGSNQQVLYTQDFLPYEFSYHHSNGRDPLIVFASAWQNKGYTFAMMTTSHRTVTVAGDNQLVGISEDGKWIIFVETGQRGLIRTIFRVNVETRDYEVLVAGLIRYTAEWSRPIIDHVSMSPDQVWVYFEVVDANGMASLQQVQAAGGKPQIVHQGFGNNNGRPLLRGWINYQVDEPSRWWVVGVIGVCFSIVMLVGRLFRIVD